ncbi:ATP-binding cassette domain-containing protein [Methanocella arvoryzae]|uniref:ABC-type transport system, ATPase component n=1 Tax=Methanocella arvoryzae (strain DSM 22066 / NBRC 105507 / MRE50) TaxID=351160 RepID=Q0W476_METAR|nr:ATP-binding cassette domain-containing protein [Methanocella arvoryzae]CAJ36817.1 ABC-type transport system, ATPase component [Methanocella arvoryzae MRE50]
MDIDTITIRGGTGKDGKPEPLSAVEFRMGDVVSIVGPTGCGKTTLINDLELFADGDTPSGRKILINGQARPEEFLSDPSRNPIALISQHTNFLSDLPVGEFLRIHAGVRQSGNPEQLVKETLEFANQLTGEPLNLQSAMTELSGGQTRSLLIADAVIIGNAPIILLDEIENAGIHRTKALELLRKYRKIFVFVTHDPRIALMSDYRIVIGNGAMRELIVTDEEEKAVVGEIKKIDDLLLDFRSIVRAGGRLTTGEMARRMRAIGYVEGA